MKAKAVARLGILSALALVLGWLDRLIPIAPGLPGIKLGLANTVLLYGLYMLNGKSALLLMLIKVLLTGFLFSPSGMLFSFAGSSLSLCMMFLAKRLPFTNIVAVSAAGGVFHNVGQCLVAWRMVLGRAVLAYLPWLLAAGLVMGLLTGIVAKYTLQALQYGKARRG